VEARGRGGARDADGGSEGGGGEEEPFINSLIFLARSAVLLRALSLGEGALEVWVVAVVVEEEEGEEEGGCGSTMPVLMVPAAGG